MTLHALHFLFASDLRAVGALLIGVSLIALGEVLRRWA